MNVLSRRACFKAVPIAGAVFAVPSLAAPPSTPAARKHLIRSHAEALLALIREEIPEGQSQLSVSVRANWGPDPSLNAACSVSAVSSRIEWKADERLRGGGLWVSGNSEDWRLG